MPDTRRVRPSDSVLDELCEIQQRRWGIQPDPSEKFEVVIDRDPTIDHEKLRGERFDILDDDLKTEFLDRLAIDD